MGYFEVSVNHIHQASRHHTHHLQGMIQIQIFLFFALFQKVATEIKIHYKSKKKNKTTNYVNHER